MIQGFAEKSHAEEQRARWDRQVNNLNKTAKKQRFSRCARVPIGGDEFIFNFSNINT